MWSTRILPKIIVLIVGFFVLVVVAVGFRSIFKPQSTFVISGEHNPVENYLYVNGVRLFPQGEGGKNYIGKLESGKNTVVFHGPLIKTISYDINAGLIGGNKVVELSVVSLVPEDIVKDLFGDTKVKPEGSRFFYDSKIIVSSVLNIDEDGEENYSVVMLRYDLENGVWKNITEEFLADFRKYSLGDNVLNYFYGLDEE